MSKTLSVITILATCIFSFTFTDVFAEKYNHNNLSLELPDGWVETKTAYAEEVKAVFEKKVEDDLELTPIMLVAISDEEVGGTLSDLVEKAISIVTSEIPEAKFLFERDVFTGKVKWREIIYQYSDAGYSFQVVQYHAIYKNRHYAFTGQCLQKYFSEYLGDFRKTFNTWTFRSN